MTALLRLAPCLGDAVPRRTALRALAATSWLAVLGAATVGPTLALWVGGLVQGGGAPSMSSISAVVGVLAAVSCALILLLARLDSAQARLAGVPQQPGRLTWLHGRRRPSRRQRAARRPGWRQQPARSGVMPAAGREPLVLIAGNGGAGRPWRDVAPQLEFGFDVLAGVLTRDGSVDGTERAMDRAGWPSAHLVARRADALAAIELARRGRASSLLILDEDPAAGEPAAVAAAIAASVAFRPAA